MLIVLSLHLLLARSSDNQMPWVMLLFVGAQFDHLGQHTPRPDIASHMPEFL
jgi:hypothetical protein